MKPGVVQELKHGKLLTRRVYPFFVDTWNWVVRNVNNLKGDNDVRPDGLITVDRTDPDAPVIRFRLDLLKDFFGTGGEVSPKPWDIVPASDGEEDYRIFVRRYYQVGGVLREYSTGEERVEDFVLQESIEDDRPWIAFRHVATVGGSDTDAVVGYATIEELLEAQRDPRYLVKPLYWLSHEGDILCDFRAVLDMGAWEVG